MLPPHAPPVNPALPRALPLLLLALSACAPEARAPHARRPASRQIGLSPEAHREDLSRENGLREATQLGHLPEPEPWLHLSERERAAPPPEVTLLSGLGPDLLGLEVDLERGASLMAYVDEEIPRSRWSRYGLAALTYEEVWGETGDDGLCEEGALIDTFEAEDGSAWEASYAVGRFGHLLDRPEPILEVISDDCAASLLAAAGDLEAALDEDCDEYDEHTFFPEGSDCRACLEREGGDYAVCVETDLCPEEAITASWTIEAGEKVWWRTAVAYLWACAPDLPVPMYLMADISDQGEMPEPFDHAAWAYFCVPYWDDGAGEPVYGCSDGTGGWAYGHTLGEGAVGRVNFVRAEGDEGEPHYDRLWYAHSMKIRGGPTIDRFWATAPGSGQISMPDDGLTGGDPDLQLPESLVTESAAGRWGLNPYALRPDGEDESELDDTYARDWLATLTLKTATTIDGIYIRTYNHNRCVEGAWEGPFADGSYRCEQLDPPSVGWGNDVSVGPWALLDLPGSWQTQDFVQQFYMPLATLGSTGLPDPLVPGGATVLVAGTEALADEDWDSASWPHTFTPDQARYEARAYDYDGDRWLWGDTYRFGKDPDLDLRVVLNTNQLRGYRPEETNDDQE